MKAREIGRRVNFRGFLGEQDGKPASVVGRLQAFRDFLEPRRRLCAGTVEGVAENGLTRLQLERGDRQACFVLHLQLPPTANSSRQASMANR